MSATKNPLPFGEKVRRQHREWSGDPFENSPFDRFPKWMFEWSETNRCPSCLELSWYAIRGENGGTYCPHCEHRLPARWFTDKRASLKEATHDE